MSDRGLPVKSPVPIAFQLGPGLGPAIPPPAILPPFISQIAAWPLELCHRMSERPSPAKSEGAEAPMEVIPPLCLTTPWITPLLVKPPMNTMLPESTSSTPLLAKFVVTSLTPPPVFWNKPLLMNCEGGAPEMSVLPTTSYVPVFVTVIGPLSVAPPVMFSTPDSDASPSKTSDNAPEIVPEKFAAPKVRVAGAPLSVTEPAPTRSLTVALNPPRSRAAPAATVVCGLLLKIEENPLSAPLSVPAWILMSPKEGTTLPAPLCQRTVPSSPEAPKFSVVFAARR